MTCICFLHDRIKSVLLRLPCPLLLLLLLLLLLHSVLSGVATAADFFPFSSIHHVIICCSHHFHSPLRYFHPPALWSPSFLSPVSFIFITFLPTYSASLLLTVYPLLNVSLFLQLFSLMCSFIILSF